MFSAQSYAIIGTGALGGLYGGMLARRGFDVHFLANSDVAHLEQSGLKVESHLGDFISMRSRFILIRHHYQHVM